MSNTTTSEPSWDDAMQEQQGGAKTDASWEEALREQTEKARPAFLSEPAAQAAPATFQPLSAAARAPAADVNIALLKNVPVLLTAELGHTRLTIGEFLSLSQGSVIELNEVCGQPLDIKINGMLLAHGEVVVVKDKYGIRLTDIVSPPERVAKLGS